MAVAGGLGQLTGALVGSALVMVLKNGVQDVLPLLSQRGGQLEAVVFAALFILLLHFARAGVMGFVARWTTGRFAPPDIPGAAARRAAAAAGAACARRLRCCRSQRGQALRRPGGGQRRELRCPCRRDRRPDRPERCRQVDDVQPAHRHAADDGGTGRVPRPGHHRPAAARDRAPRHGAHLPAREAAAAHEPARQRRARRARARTRRGAAARAAPRTARGARRYGRGPAPARAHRPGRPRARAGRQPAAGHAAHPRDRSRAGRRPGAAGARRAGRRPAPQGEAGAGRRCCASCATRA